jgi:hypothetical protein
MCEGDVKTCFNGEDCIRNIDDRGKSFYHCQCDALESDLSTPAAHQFWYVLYYDIVSYPTVLSCHYSICVPTKLVHSKLIYFRLIHISN